MSVRQVQISALFFVTCLVILAACQPAVAPTPLPPPTQEKAQTPVSSPTPFPRTPTPAPGVLPTPTLRLATATAAPSTATPSGVQPQYGDTLHVILKGEPAHHDPLTSNWPIAYGPALESLLRRNLVTGEPECELCSSWEYKDPTTLLFKMRQGVKFQNVPPVNGREMTADDVVFSLNRLVNPALNSPSRSRFDLMESVAALDKYTVQMKLKQPSAGFMYIIPPHPIVIPKEAIEKSGDFKDPNNKIGTGPFLAGRYNPGIGGSMRKNPDYWKTGKPYMDGYDLTVISDDATILAAWRTGRLDLASDNTGGFGNLQQAKDLQRTHPRIQLFPLPRSNTTALIMHLAKKPFDDVRVRKAIFLALDRQEMIKVNLGGPEGGGVTGPLYWRLFPEWTWNEDELLKMPGYRQPKDADRAEAKRLLADAGFGAGLKLQAEGSEFVPFTNLDAMVAAKSQLGSVGIDITIKIIDQTQWFGQDASGDFYFRSRGYGAALEPGDQLVTRHRTGASRNYQKYSNPQVDKLLDEQAVTVDVVKRKELLMRAQQILMEDVPQIWLYTVHAVAVRQPWVKGPPPTIYGGSYPEELWIDKNELRR